jgi:branched-chain amino acid transport system permease protein
MISFPLLLQSSVSGFSTGWIYALVAVGLSLIFELMNIVNFAHGD